MKKPQPTGENGQLPGQLATQYNPGEKNIAPAQRKLSGVRSLAVRHRLVHLRPYSVFKTSDQQIQTVKCCSKHLRIRTARLILDKKMEEVGKQRRQNMDRRKVGTKLSSSEGQYIHSSGLPTQGSLLSVQSKNYLTKLTSYL